MVWCGVVWCGVVSYLVGAQSLCSMIRQDVKECERALVAKVDIRGRIQVEQVVDHFVVQLCCSGHQGGCSFGAEGVQRGAVTH